MIVYSMQFTFFSNINKELSWPCIGTWRGEGKRTVRIGLSHGIIYNINIIEGKKIRGEGGRKEGRKERKKWMEEEMKEGRKIVQVFVDIFLFRFI